MTLPPVKEGSVSRTPRGARADGEATRANILEAAGQLFAERGYSETTSKAICERSHTNMAAVNYYFGSREGLYIALLKEVHQRLMSMAFLRRLVESAIPGEEKLGVFLEGLIGGIVDAQSWHTRLWAREILAPSPLLSQVMREEALPKFGLLSSIVGEITGRSPDDPELPCYVFSVIAPCLVLLVVDRRVDTPIQDLFQRPAKELAAQILAFALAGLRDARRPRRKK